jgi:hypothetical protein
MCSAQFSYNGRGYFTPVTHGHDGYVLAKLDSGARVSVVNVAALQCLTGFPISDISQAIKNSGTPHHEFHGFNGAGSTLYLCLLSNLQIGNGYVRGMYVATDLDERVCQNGKSLPKFLLGMDFLRKCSGTLVLNGDFALEPDQGFASTLLNPEIARLFQGQNTPIFSIDEIYR